MAGGAGTILDSLGFVEHHQVESQIEVTEDFTVALNDFVVGDLHRHVRLLPLPASFSLVSFDDRQRQLRGPGVEFALPVGHQWLGAYQEHAVELPRVQQQAHRRDRLHGLSQPHLIGQDGAIARIQKGHAFHLVGEGMKGKRQRAIANQRFERWLEYVEQTILQLDHVTWRRNPRAGSRTGFRR